MFIALQAGGGGISAQSSSNPHNAELGTHVRPSVYSGGEYCLTHTLPDILHWPHSATRLLRSVLSHVSPVLNTREQTWRLGTRRGSR